MKFSSWDGLWKIPSRINMSTSTFLACSIPNSLGAGVLPHAAPRQSVPFGWWPCCSRRSVVYLLGGERRPQDEAPFLVGALRLKKDLRHEICYDKRGGGYRFLHDGINGRPLIMHVLSHLSRESQVPSRHFLTDVTKHNRTGFSTPFLHPWNGVVFGPLTPPPHSWQV